MLVEVNGEPREVAAGTTIAQLVSSLVGSDGPVAVERNEEIVPRALHATTTLTEGDQLEIVQFVGGG